MDSEQNEFLMIGGTNNGERMSFDKPLLYVEVPEKTTPSKAGQYDRDATYETEVYRLERMCGDSEMIQFYVLAQLTTDDALRLLFKNYLSPLNQPRSQATG